MYLGEIQSVTDIILYGNKNIKKIFLHFMLQLKGGMII